MCVWLRTGGFHQCWLPCGTPQSSAKGLARESPYSESNSRRIVSVRANVISYYAV